MSILKVKALPGVLVMDPHALDAGIRRFVGCEQLASAQPGIAGIGAYWAPVAAGVEIADHSHLRDAVKKGELVALDDYTAKRCGVSLVKKGAK